MANWDAIVCELPAMRRYARGLVHDKGLADDLVQSSAERAFHKWHLFQSQKKLRPWLFRILHNLYIDYLRQNSVLESLHESFDHVADPCPPGWMTSDLTVALMKIKPAYREVLLLADVEEFSYQEIGIILGVPKGTVMSRLSRAREAMRELLKEYRHQSDRVRTLL